MSNNMARVGDFVSSQTHAHNVGVPPIPVVFPVIGQFTSGSSNVFVNDKAAVREGDTGTHVVCSGPNTFKAKESSSTVFINDKKACREGDNTIHCDGDSTVVPGTSEGIVLGFCSHNTFAG